MPGINDHPDQVRPIVERAKAAGATFLGSAALHLRDEVKDVFYAWLQEKRPDLLPKYEALYGNRANMRPAQRRHATRAIKGWGRGRTSRQNAPRAGGDDADSSPVGEGAASETGPARQSALF